MCTRNWSEEKDWSEQHFCHICANFKISYTHTHTIRTERRYQSYSHSHPQQPTQTAEPQFQFSSRSRIYRVRVPFDANIEINTFAFVNCVSNAVAICSFVLCVLFFSCFCFYFAYARTHVKAKKWNKCARKQIYFRRSHTHAHNFISMRILG